LLAPQREANYSPDCGLIVNNEDFCPHVFSLWGMTFWIGAISYHKYDILVTMDGPDGILSELRA
jgi:hypothetical protein